MTTNQVLLGVGLIRLGLDSTGVICVERVDATLTSRALPAADHGALRRETAPVWEMVEAVIVTRRQSP